MTTPDEKSAREDVAEQEASTLSLYIGIPTQGFRSIQADLAGLVGQLLTIAHEYHESGGSGGRYVPLVRGASSYISVFGYWMGDGKSTRRFDDHTEVIEFVFRPKELGAITALVLAEIVCPALVCARQHEVLTVIRHKGKQFQLGVVRASERHRKQTRGVRNQEKLSPTDILDHLTRLCLRGWLAVKPNLDYSPPAEQSLRARLVDSFGNWCWKAHSVVHYPGGDEETVLPTIRHRLLAIAASWWLIRDLGPERAKLPGARVSKSDPAKPPVAEPTAGADHESLRGFVPTIDQNPNANLIEIEANINQAFAMRRGHLLLELLDEELTATATEWCGTRAWFRAGFHGADLHGADPLANTLLWLAYTGDYLSWYLGTERSGAWPPEGSAPGMQGAGRFAWVAERVAPLQWAAVARDVAGLPADGWDFWKRRLEILSRVNDTNFPDQPFLATWSLLGRLLPAPWRPTDDNHRPPKVGITAAGAADLDWWTETAKLWNYAPAGVRHWLSALVLDRVHLCVLEDPRLKAAYTAFVNDTDPIRPGWSLAGLIQRLESPLAASRTAIDPLTAILETAPWGYPVVEDLPQRRLDPPAVNPALQQQPLVAPVPPDPSDALVFVGIVQPSG